MPRPKIQILLSKKVSFYSLSALLIIAGVVGIVPPRLAHASTLAQVMVRFDRLQTSQPTTGTVCAKPTNVAATEASVQVVFPTGYTVNTTLSNWTVNTTATGWPTGGAAWPGIGTASAASGQTVTFPSTDLASGTTLYCFNWTNTAAVSVTSSVASTNTGTVITRTSAPATIDSASYSTVSIAADQISVSATVPQSFTFTLTGTTDTLGTLSTGSVITSPSASTATISTNANSGWMVWASDANNGLKSTAAVHTIPDSPSAGTASSTTLGAGTEGYNFGVTGTQGGGAGTLAISNAYNGVSPGQGGGLDTTLRTIASSNGTANNAVLTLKNNVAISTLTNAATDYADVETVVGAALF
jgi:hypothetical protein